MAEIKSSGSEDIFSDGLFRKVYTVLLKRTVLLSRNHHFSQAEIEGELTASLGEQQLYRRQMTELLGALRAIGIIESVQIPTKKANAKVKFEEKYRLREDSLGRKLALLNHRRQIVLNLINNKWQINGDPKVKPDFAPVRRALGNLKGCLDQRKAGDGAVSAVEFVNLHGEFWAALAQVAKLDYWHQVLRQLGAQITLSRIAFPESLEQVYDACMKIVIHLEEGNTDAAYEKANTHLKQFEEDLEQLNSFLREAETWKAGQFDSAEKARLVTAILKPMRGMIMRIVVERRIDYPNVAKLSIQEQQWEETFQALVTKVVPLLPTFARRYHKSRAEVGQPITWFVHLIGQMLSDPVELLEISKAACTKREIEILELMAGGKTFPEIAAVLKIEKDSVIVNAQNAKRKVLDKMEKIDGMSGKVERIEALTDDISFSRFFSTWDA